MRTRIVQSLDAPSCEGQFSYSKFQNFSQPKYKIFLVDLPANSLWQTLRDEFPEAKVILVVRDDQKWINSLQNHLVVSFYLWNFSIREIFSGHVSGEPAVTSCLRLNDNSYGKCGSTAVSVQSTDGFLITVQKQSPCIWTTLGKLPKFITDEKDGRPNSPDFKNKFDWPRRSTFPESQQ